MSYSCIGHLILIYEVRMSTRSVAVLRAAEVVLPPPSEYARKDGPEKLRCPAQFCEFRSEILTSYLNRMCTQTESLLFFVFFFTKIMATFVFFRVFISVISLERKKKEKKAGFMSVG